MRWGCRLVFWLSTASAVAASMAPPKLQVPKHAALQRVLLAYNPPPELSPEKMEEDSKKGIERHGEVEKEVTTQKVKGDKEMTEVMTQARSYVVHVVFFIGVLLILCCCMCCLFYLPRKNERKFNPIIDVVKEDRIKLQAQQPQFVNDIVNSIQFQSWSDSFFDRYLSDSDLSDGTVDLKDLRDVVVQVYGRYVERHWIFIKAFDSKRPERISCDEFLEIMMYFECKQYETTRRTSTIPGLTSTVDLQVSRTQAPSSSQV